MTIDRQLSPVALASSVLRRVSVALIAVLALGGLVGVARGRAASSVTAGTASTTADVLAQTATGQDPALGVSLAGGRVTAVSDSPAPLQATVAALPSGAVVERLGLARDAGAELGLPSGSYRICVAQAAAMPWAASGACATGSWHAAAPASVAIDAIRARGHSLALTVTVRERRWLRSALAGHRAFTGRLQITLARGAGRRALGVIAMPEVYVATRRLHAGRQVLRLRLPERVAPGDATVRLVLAGRIRGGSRIGLGTVAARVRVRALAA